MLVPCLMVQGTASSAGKSLLCAALCRLFARAGWRVAPFKAQNMALNAAVTVGGGEIGRAQAAQAEAAGVEPTVDMNPILLKPESDRRSQVVVRGRALGSVDFREYAALGPALLPVVAESLARLRRAHELVVIEGAGNPAEINLSSTDLANMRVARLADAPVILVGDIDRGGLFAALLGTLELLEPEDRARVAGLVVNKFRGDPALLAPGLDAVARAAAAGRPVLGVCGGYQMLGEAVHDPDGVESDALTVRALGLLPVETTFARRKTTVRVCARVAPRAGPFAAAAGRTVRAYEIHAGRTEGHGAGAPFAIVERGGAEVADLDGAVNAAGTVLGTYLHGLFADARLRRALLTHLAAWRGIAADPRWGAPRAGGRDRLADAVGGALDLPAVAKLVGLRFPRR